MFVIGDIHGAYRALQQCLSRANFDYEADHLVCLGDVCDGWPDTRSCIEELMKIKNLTYLWGNHDLWAFQWMQTGNVEDAWVTQGGAATMASYDEQIPSSHLEFFNKALPYFISENKLFVHAGIELDRPLEHQDLKIFSWDRSLVQKAWAYLLNRDKVKLTTYDEVFVGHTPIPFPKPIQSCEVWMMDTGAGWSGVLSMMNVSTKEIVTSDPVPALYPGVKGRILKK